MATAAALAAGAMAEPARADGPDTGYSNYSYESHYYPTGPIEVVETAGTVVFAGPWQETIVVTMHEDGTVDENTAQRIERERKITVEIDGDRYDFYTTDPEDGVFQAGSAVGVTYSKMGNDISIDELKPLIS